MMIALVFFLLMLPVTTHAQVIGAIGVETEPCNTGCGLVITQVFPTSPADFIGLRRGDIIEQLNGKDIYDDYVGFNNYIANNPGRTVSLTVSRNDYVATRNVRIDTIPVTLNHPPSNKDFAQPTNMTVNNYYGNMKHNTTNQNGNGNTASQNNQR